MKSVFEKININPYLQGFWRIAALKMGLKKPKINYGEGFLELELCQRKRRACTRFAKTKLQI